MSEGKGMARAGDNAAARFGSSTGGAGASGGVDASSVNADEGASLLSGISWSKVLDLFIPASLAKGKGTPRSPDNGKDPTATSNRSRDLDRLLNRSNRLPTASTGFSTGWEEGSLASLLRDRDNDLDPPSPLLFLVDVFAS